MEREMVSENQLHRIKEGVEAWSQKPYKNGSVAQFLDQMVCVTQDPLFLRGKDTIEFLNTINQKFDGVTLVSEDSDLVLTPEDRVKYIECGSREEYLTKLFKLQNANGVTLPWLIYVDCFIPVGCGEVFQIYLEPHHGNDTVSEVAIYVTRELLKTGVPCLVFASKETLDLLQGLEDAE